MRAPRVVAALAFGLALLPGLTASDGRADDAPLPERQQQASDILAKLDSKLVPTREQFVAGSVAFAIYHELGHFLIDEFDIPNLGGREEDMADAYAVFELGPHAAKEQMQSAVRLWLNVAYMRGATPIAWWDEHSLDAQRAFQVACFLSGRWPETYAGLPEAFGAPARRAGHCVTEAYRTQAAWVETLRAQSAAVIHKQRAKVTYVPAPLELTDTQKWLTETSLLDGIALEIGRYRLPDWRIEEQEASAKLPPARARDMDKPHVEVVGKSCGVANAYYELPRGKRSGGVFSGQGAVAASNPKLVLCYEFIQLVRNMAQQTLPK